MTVILPSLNNREEYNKPESTGKPGESVLEQMHERGDDVIVLKNREPVWCEETGSYVLNFNGRVSFASIKNFQLVHPKDRKLFKYNNIIEEYIVETFGRIGADSFSMDFTYPLTPLTAFAVAMTTFEEGFLSD